MATYFITRHVGASEWAVREGVVVDKQLEHLDITIIMPNDVVIGILPIHLAAMVCAKGADFYHVSIDMPREARGKEMTADDLERYGARLEQYKIKRFTDERHTDE